MARTSLAPPFTLHGRATGEYFADRATEVKHVATVLRTPGAKVLVRGRRRMGKTSILDMAAARARRAGVLVLSADLSTAQTLTEVASQLLLAANDALGQRWQEILTAIAKRVGTAVQMTFGEDGRPVLALSPALFGVAAPEQGRTLGQVLDAINATAEQKRQPVGIILDEFQEIETIADRAGWRLRGIIQRHDAVSYVCAGSRQHLIDALAGPNGPFYKLLDPAVDVGPIDAAFLADWLESRLGTHGVHAARGVGARCVSLAGPCTLDVLRVGHALWTRGLESGRATVADVDAAFAATVAGLSDGLLREWERCSPVQQQTLRAVAGAHAGLTTSETVAAFRLGPSGRVIKSVTSLVHRETIRKDPAASPVGYVFDSPFLRGWVIAHALRDLGMELPITTLPGEGRP